MSRTYTDPDGLVWTFEPLDGGTLRVSLSDKAQGYEAASVFGPDRVIELARMFAQLQPTAVDALRAALLNRMCASNDRARQSEPGS